MSERDPELDALWRAQSQDEPPAALDDAILAAAHRAVHAEPTSTTARARSTWPAWAGFAAAASIGAIAIGVWQLQPHDVDETKVVASDVPPSVVAPTPRQEVAAQRAAAVPSPPASPNAAQGKPKPGGAPPTNDAIDDAQRRVLTAPGLPPEDVDRQALAAAAPAAADERQRATAKVAPDAPPANAAAAANGADTAAVPPVNATQAREARESRPSVAAEAAPRPAPFPAETSNVASAMRPAASAGQTRMAAAPSASRDQAREVPTAKASASGAPPAAPKARASVAASAKTTGDYIAAIRRALAEHRDADARAELKEMRAEFEFADAALPDDLHAWAKGVPRVAR